MTKEIETWIEENNPYCNDREVSAWEEGAKSMADNLQNQPPTKEQILKILRIYFQNDDVPCIGCGDFELDKKYVEQCVEQIIKHLNNE